MPKTAFDPDELTTSAGKLKKVAGSLHGIGTNVISASNDLTGDPQAGALAADSARIFSDLPSIHQSLDQTGNAIMTAVQQFQQASGSPPPGGQPNAPQGFDGSGANFGDLFSSIGAGLHNEWNDVHHYLSQKNVQSTLKQVALWSGVVAGAAGLAATVLAPIPGVDALDAPLEAVAETAGAVNVASDALLIAGDPHDTAAEFDLGMAATGLATGGASRGLTDVKDISAVAKFVRPVVKDPSVVTKLPDVAKTAAATAAKSATKFSDVTDAWGEASAKLVDTFGTRPWAIPLVTGSKLLDPLSIAMAGGQGFNPDA